MSATVTVNFGGWMNNQGKEKPVVFISWSGDLSRQLAAAVDDWLPTALHGVKTFFSRNIETGTTWEQDILDGFASSAIGIICLTKENIDAFWIHYEAGGLIKYKSNDERIPVCPILFDLNQNDLKRPLSSLQCTTFSREGFRKLFETINKEVGSVSDKDLDTVFERAWPSLQESVQKILSNREPPKIVVGWSGKNGHILARALAGFLNDATHCDPWVPPGEIGQREWLRETCKELQVAELTILVVVRGDGALSALHFKAGAAWSFGDRPVLIYALNVEQESLDPPIRDFDFFTTNASDTQTLFTRVAKLATGDSFDSQGVERAFSENWPGLEETIMQLKPDFSLSSTNLLGESEKNAKQVRAFNFSLDSEVGRYVLQEKRFDESSAYLIDTVVKNIKKKRGVTYQYILASPDLCEYSEWVEQTMAQAKKLWEVLKDKGAADKLHLIHLSLLCVPSPIIGWSLDLHIKESVDGSEGDGDRMEGWWCREGKGRDGNIFGVGDSDWLKEIWAGLEEITENEDFGISRPLDKLVGEIDQIREKLMEHEPAEAWKSPEYRKLRSQIYGKVLDRIEGALVRDG